MKIGFFGGIIAWLLSFCVQAQEGDSLRPRAAFLTEKVKIGEPAELALFLYYPSAYQILFPDTNAGFGSFTLIGRSYFPTRTIGDLSRDCVVYKLAAFSDDTVQTVSLPVYRFAEGDSLVYYAPPARIRVENQIRGTLPAQPVFEESLSPLPVPRQINYPYILIGMGIVVALLLLLNLFFDRPVQKFFYLFLEQRRHQVFLRSFARLRARLAAKLSVEEMENLLVLWKKYIQRVDGKPYTSLTTQEIFNLLPDEKLRDVLRETDRWVYGGVEMEDYNRNISYVLEVSVRLYQKKREAIRNGKLE